ncbi:unnamed protein product, partial [Vitis vinifera]
MAKKYVRENVPLSRFGVLVAQLESIVASSSQQPPDALLCFDLLSDLISAIDEEPKESILLWQRKCEDALYSLLILGARRPVRHLASVAMARIISKGDTISIYSRASTLQGFLSDGKRSEPQRLAGAAQCLGELYRLFGRRITSGLLETTIIATKLMKFHEEFVRLEALHMLQNALEGSGGSAASSAYSEAFRLIMRFAVGDKSFIVRIAAARCLRAFANIGGPGLGAGEFDNSASYCVKVLDDPVSSVRDAFAEALGALVALGMNPEAQVQPKGKGHVTPTKKLEGGLQRYLVLPFVKASGVRLKNIRIGLTFSWVFFLQAIRLKYLHPDSELQNFALQIMDMLRADSSVDAQALACVLYILRVGVTDQMTEPTQRSFLVLLGKQLQSPDLSPFMAVAALRTLSYTLKTLGEVPLEFKEVLDNTVVAAMSHSSQLVRIEAALTLRALAEVDPTCVGGLVSYGVTTLNALRENVSFEKEFQICCLFHLRSSVGMLRVEVSGIIFISASLSTFFYVGFVVICYCSKKIPSKFNLRVELDSLHGQAAVLAALVSISPKLPLGYPARLPRSVLEVSKKMLLESSRNPVAATVEKEAGWLLLSSLLASMPKEELEDEVFDILSLWASLFSGNPEHQIMRTGDLSSSICVWSAAVDALTAFVKCFVPSNTLNNGILLQPVLLYLSRALSYISFLAAKELPNVKPELDIFIIRTLIAYQSLPDPMAYTSEHAQILQLCTTPFRDASGCAESSCLRLLLDNRDAWLGPWTPGRDWFEDELRAFQGGKDGLVPCVWESEVSSFPQPDTIRNLLVNQMLLCFGIMFASQDNGGMMSLLGMLEQCLKTGKKQLWHAASVTNICVGLLAGLKALLALRSHGLGLEILNSAQAIFQNILAEGDICASQRRASSEGLGLLARLGNDMFTARMTRSLLGDLTGATDSNYAGSIAVALGCIHRSAGGMALSTLVPATVSSISSLAKSAISSLKIWSLHGLLLTIEAAGLSYVSHVQATLGLAMDILLSEENVWIDLQQGVGRLINAIVAVLGPELAPGSIFFSRCKSVIAEISSWQETSTLLESVRFTQQLVLFAPQAVSVHSHVQTLLPTLSSRQPTLRHRAVSTIRHLIEKDPVSVIDEQIEDNLFHMLDEETDSEIGNLARNTIMRLLYASCPLRPSHWISICRNMVLATSTGRNAGMSSNVDHDPSNGVEGEATLNFGDDDENMVSSSKGMAIDAYTVSPNRDKLLRYRTRLFAAECLSCLPVAVGTNPSHFDLSLARRQRVTGQGSSDWLVLHIQELISLAYQISTIQFESMQPIGVGLLCSIVEKFEMTSDPELPGHLLLEQYQAQLVSAVRIALDTSSGPILLEAGLKLATKMLTSGIISGDQVAVKRIFSLISRPLDDFKDLYYPSFAEWVSCQIQIRLLAAHASLKCYTYAFLRRHHTGVPDEYLALLPLFAKSSRILGKYWIWILKDYSYICFRLHLKRNWKPFLDGIQSPFVSSKLHPCLDETWPVILQALALDAVPMNLDISGTKQAIENESANATVSGYSMVELEPEEFRFLWGFALLVLFQGQQPSPGKQIIPLGSAKAKPSGDSPVEETNPLGLKLYEIVLPVFQFLAMERFFSMGFLTIDICQELLQVFSYSIQMEQSWISLAISVLSQIVQNCPEDFLETENFAYSAMELCSAYLFRVFQSADAISPDQSNWEDLISPLFMTVKTLLGHFEPKKQLKSVLAFLLIGYKCIRAASTESSCSKVHDFVQYACSLFKKHVDDKSKLGDDFVLHLKTILQACLKEVAKLTRDCVEAIHLVEKKRSNLHKMLQMKLAFSLEQIYLFAKQAHEIECLRENEDSNPYFTLLKHCMECFQAVLTDFNIQVQLIGMQVLKSIIQRGTNLESNSFLVFFAGELFVVLFTTIQNTLKKPITRESVAVAGECLRILLLLQTLSKSSECQRGLIHLLLEAIVMIFSASEDGPSVEVNDIRSTAIRLVSHLAQMPSSVVHFRDLLLAMPLTHRQQLQGIIRASVTQDHSSIQMKPPTPSLEIKLPMQTEGQREKASLQVQTEESREKVSPQPSTPVHSDVNSEEEDEDDWDAFQSFPASTNAAASDSKVEIVAEEYTPAENSLVSNFDTKDDDFQKYTASESFDSVKEAVAEDNEETRKEEMISDNLGDTNEVEKIHDSGTNHQTQEYSASQSCNQVKERMGEGHGETSIEVISDTLGGTNEIEEHHHHQEGGAMSTQENKGQALADLGPTKDSGELRAVNLVEDQQWSNDSHVNINEIQASSDPLSHERISDSESYGEADGKTDSEEHQESGKPSGLQKGQDEADGK